MLMFRLLACCEFSYSTDNSVCWCFFRKHNFINSIRLHKKDLMQKQHFKKYQMGGGTLLLLYY